jgi:6-phosphogluconolactonase
MTGTTRTLARLKSAGLITALFAISAASAAPPPADTDSATYVYIGTHGGKGPDEGIFAAKLDEKTGAITGLGLAANVERPMAALR